MYENLNIKIWIAGQKRSDHADGWVWDFQGVFASRDDALAACTDKETGKLRTGWFIAPAIIGQELPIEQFPFPGGEIF